MATTIDVMLANLEGKRQVPKVPPPKRATVPVPAPSAVTQRAPGGGGWGRSIRVRLPIEDELWLMGVVGDALKSGKRVREVDVVRLAVRRLRDNPVPIDAL